VGLAEPERQDVGLAYAGVGDLADLRGDQSAHDAAGAKIVRDGSAVVHWIKIIEWIVVRPQRVARRLIISCGRIGSDGPESSGACGECGYNPASHPIHVEEV